MKVQFKNQTNGTNLKVIGKKLDKVTPIFFPNECARKYKVHLIEIT
jgi:hypothetical protein